MRLRKRSASKFFQSKSGLTSTEFALLGAVIAVVAALAVKEIGGAMSSSMYSMADNVGGNDPTPVTPAGDGDGGGDPNGGGDNGEPSGGDPNAGGNDPTDAGAPPPPSDPGKKKKKKKKKKD